MELVQVYSSLCRREVRGGGAMVIGRCRETGWRSRRESRLPEGEYGVLQGQIGCRLDRELGES